MEVQSTWSQFKSTDVQSINVLSNHINFVQKQIDRVHKTTQMQMQELEDKKRRLKHAIGDENISATHLEEHIKDLMMNHSDILDEINKLTDETITEKNSIVMLNQAITIMDREVARIQEDQNNAVLGLREKKDKLKLKLDSIDEVHNMIMELEDTIEHDTAIYDKQVKVIGDSKAELMNREDLNDEELIYELEQLDDKIEGITKQYTEDIEFMQKQRQDMEFESMAITQDLNQLLNETFMGGTDDYLEEIKRLEELKLLASPSKMDGLNKAISFYRSRLTEEELKIHMPLMDRINEFLKLRSLHITDSGNIRNIASGKILTKEILNETGLFEELDKYLVESYGLQYLEGNKVLTTDGRILTRDQAYKLNLLEKYDLLGLLFFDESERSDVSSRDSEFQSEDAIYLKKYLGIPLTLALAEITAKQPRDPIHYLGHWLLKYRYNQEVDQIKKIEVDELINMRNKIAKEKWDRFVEEEARKAILDIVDRAESQGDKNEFERELERIANETDALENDDDGDALEEEARDTLGEYRGPTVNQRGPTRT